MDERARKHRKKDSAKGISDAEVLNVEELLREAKALLEADEVT